MSAPVTERLAPPPAGPGASTLTVVVPTYNERDNMAPLIARLGAALSGVPARILVVDDSDDGTTDVVRELASSALVQVDVLHRALGERAGGLGGAVAAGRAGRVHPHRRRADVQRARQHGSADRPA